MIYREWVNKEDVLHILPDKPNCSCDSEDCEICYQIRVKKAEEIRKLRIKELETHIKENVDFIKKLKRKLHE
jgi:hypothetical protein